MAVGGGTITTLTTTSDITVQGVTVGRGAGAVSTNTAVGASALAANTTGDSNTAVGRLAATSTTTGGNNAALGEAALFLNTVGSSNTGIGARALFSNTTASNNTAVGHQAGYSNTTGDQINAFGYQALYSNTTGVRNDAFGSYALNQNTTGSYNVAVGRGSLISNTTASNNTAVGYQAGYAYTGTTGYNTFFGWQAGTAVTSGSVNTYIGPGAGNLMTSGAKNTILGAFNGNSFGLDMRTASNNIVLSDGDGNPRLYRPSSGGWIFAGQTDGYDSINCLIPGTNPYGVALNFTAAAPNNTTNYFLAGTDTTNNKFTMRSNGGLANYSGNNVNLSDRREKTNFAPAGSYLDKICAIPVQTFNYIDQNMEDDGGLTLGVVAQDVQAVAPEMVMESNWGTEEEPKMRLSIYQTDLQYALMKCIQELKAEVDSLKAQINGASA